MLSRYDPLVLSCVILAASFAYGLPDVFSINKTNLVLYGSRIVVTSW